MADSPFRLLGLIGGISWESTSHYYQMLNRMARERAGGRHSARILMWSFDFAPIAEKQEEGAWSALTDVMIDAARRLEGAGAEAIVITANTMHKMAPEIQAAVPIPLIHIADVTAAALKQKGVKKPLLLATRYTMEHAFWRDRLSKNGVDSVVPEEADRAMIHDIIFDELVHGKFTEPSRRRMLAVAEKERARGIDGVILGCTEIGLLTPTEMYDLPAVDTAEAHAEAAIEFALRGRA